jgi:hypothetical protein
MPPVKRTAMKRTNTGRMVMRINLPWSRRAPKKYLKRRPIRHRYTWGMRWIRWRKRNSSFLRVASNTAANPLICMRMRARGCRMSGCDRYSGGLNRLGATEESQLLVGILNSKIHFPLSNSSSMQREKMNGP